MLFPPSYDREHPDYWLERPEEDEETAELDFLDFLAGGDDQ